MISLTGDELSVDVDETLGGEIQQITFGVDELLAFHPWHAPVGVSRSRSYGDPKLDWLSEYRGGWQLLVPNAGAASTVDGIPLPFHGEWSRTRSDAVEQNSASVTLQAGTRLPLLVRRRIEILTAPARVAVTTTVENLVDRPVPFVWGEHPAFAVAPGDRIDVPAGAVIDGDDPERRSVPWPSSTAGGLHANGLDRIPTGTPVQGVHYLPDRPAGWAALRRPQVGVGLAWDLADFPHLWIWHEIGGPEFPFYGRTSLVAIEPSSSWPGDGLAAAIERGQAHWLAPGTSRSATVTVVPFRPGAGPVSGVDHDGTVSFGKAPT